jgi:hypothetical protein
LVLLAGSQHNPRDLADVRALRPVIPVRQVEDREHASRNFTEVKRIQRAPNALDHPIYRLVDDNEANRRIWEDQYVFRFFWYQKVLPLPGVSVLGVHPDETYALREQEGGAIDHRGYPIFVIHNVGRGKVFFSATDETWRWRFIHGDRFFARFWAQVLRYVGAPKLFGANPHYLLSTDRREYEPLDRIEVTLEVTDREFRPAQASSWKVLYRTPTGEEAALYLTAVKGVQGTYKGVLNATEVGRWELRADRDTAQHIDEEARTSFIVRIPDLESRQPELNREGLEQLARATGGRYFDAWDAQNLPPQIKKQAQQRTSKTGEPKAAWDRDWVLTLILVLLCCEWALRKLMRLQ